METGCKMSQAENIQKLDEEKHASLTKKEGNWTHSADTSLKYWRHGDKLEEEQQEQHSVDLKFKRHLVRNISRCPANETHCPADELNCTADEAHCTADETHCPGDETHCTADKTHCPADETHCTDHARPRLNSHHWSPKSEAPQCEAPQCEASIDPGKHVTKCTLRRFKGISTRIDVLIVAADDRANDLYINRQSATDQILIHWLDQLDSERKIDLIREKETCTTCTSHKYFKHDRCKAGYNLLMLTLADMEHDLLAAFIVDFVCRHTDQSCKFEVVLGKDKPEVFSQSENSLRLGSSDYSVRLLKECLPQDLLFEALLEVGPSGSSSMSRLLEVNAIKALEKLLGDRESVQRLRETLYDPAMLGNFMNLKMTQQAIDFFRKIILFRHNFLIPKPSKLSQPFCRIFCDAYDSGRNESTKCMREALKNIGWEDDSVQVVETLTTQQMELTTQYAIEKIQKNCSFLLFCFANHEKIEKIRDRQSLSILVIDKIITRVAVPNYIPKVVIVQACLAQGDIDLDTEARLKQHSTTLLSAEPSGEFSPKHDFLPELAEQIKAANGKTSLQEMFTAAVEKVNSKCRKSNGRTATITPVIEPFAKRVILRRYDGKENSCRICEKDIRTCSQQCMICSTCHKWYHLTCLNIDEGHLELCRKPGFNWLCKTCYDRETKMGL